MAFHTPDPTAEEASRVGFTLEEVLEPPFEVWPDNWDAAMLFVAMDTQWRVGMSGATGLDYAALPFVMRMRGIARDTWPDVFECLRVMESAALRYLHRPEAK